MGDVEGEGIEMRPGELGVVGFSADELVKEPEEDEEMDADRVRPLAEGMMMGSVRFVLHLSVKLIFV